MKVEPLLRNGFCYEAASIFVPAAGDPEILTGRRNALS